MPGVQQSYSAPNEFKTTIWGRFEVFPKCTDEDIPWLKVFEECNKETPCGYCLTLIIQDVVERYQRKGVVETKYVKEPIPEYLHHLSGRSLAMVREAKEMAKELECTIHCNEQVKRTYKETYLVPTTSEPKSTKLPRIEIFAKRTDEPISWLNVFKGCKIRCGGCLNAIMEEVVVRFQDKEVESRSKKAPRLNYLNNLTEKSLAMMEEAQEMANDLECAIRCEIHETFFVHAIRVGVENLMKNSNEDC